MDNMNNLNEMNTPENALLPDPERFFPLSPVAYVVYGILFMIPGVGLICAILFACLAKNINLRLYARACLLWYAIVMVVLAAFAAILYSKGRLFKFIRALPKVFKYLFP